MKLVKVWSLVAAILLLAATALPCVAEDPKKNDFPVGSYWDGGFLAQFTADGKLFVLDGDFLKAEAFYKINGDQILITDKNLDSACSGVGKYNWKFDGKALTFTKLKDECEGRAHHLTSRAWPRAK